MYERTDEEEERKSLKIIETKTNNQQ